MQKLETNPERAYQSHSFEDTARYISFSREEGQESFDVLTIRKHRGKAGLRSDPIGAMASVRDVLLLAQQLGYEEVIFNFCRSLYRQSGESKEYKAYKTKQLAKPEFKLWSALK